VLVEQGDELRSFADRLDLFLAKSREAYAKQAAAELGLEADVVRKDLGVLLNRLEQYQEQAQQRELEAEREAKLPKLSDEEKAEAMKLLEDPRLLERVLADFERCGIVGEETNKLVGYLAAVSRQLDKPLGVIIQSSSAAGKSALMEAILAFVPPEAREKYSAVTGQSLFYAEELDLRHKVLAIVEEEGAERATYALKLLQSEGELTIASTGKDSQTGQLKTRTYHVEGPVMILLTTTAVEVDEELLNRCLVLTVNEEREQTRAIHRLQRESLTLEGQRLQAERERILTVHRNAQRLLRPLRVIVPQAPKLSFPDTSTRTRRDHMKYLNLIRAIALLNQHQRPVQRDEPAGFDYTEATLEDIATANRLAHEVLGRSLSELAPQTRRLLLELDGLVQERCAEKRLRRQDVRFTRRQVREATGWGNTQLKIHLGRLVDFEYLTVHRGRRGPSFEYELVYDGQGKDGSRFYCGLIEVAEAGATHAYDVERSGPNEARSGLKDERSGPDGVRSGSGRPAVGPRSGGGRGGRIDASPCATVEKSSKAVKEAETADPGRPAPAGRRTRRPVVAVAEGQSG